MRSKRLLIAVYFMFSIAISSCGPSEATINAQITTIASNIYGTQTAEADKDKAVSTSGPTATSTQTAVAIIPRLPTLTPNLSIISNRNISERLISSIDYSTWDEDTLMISPDLRRVAFASSIGNDMLMVIDLQVEGPYDNLDIFFSVLPIFSENGQGYAYSAQKDNQWFVVKDGLPGKRYEQISPAIISPNSQSVAYQAQSGGRWFVVLDGEEQGPYRPFTTFLPFFSPDSQRLAYSAKIDDQWFMVIDSELSNGYDKTNSSRPVFSPDSKHLAYQAELEEKAFMVLDGVEGKYYDSTSNVTFSPNSQRYAYSARDGAVDYIIVDGREEGSHNNVWSDVLFSPDSQRIAYNIKEGDEYFIIVDGEKQGPPGNPLINVPPIFSPDSMHILYYGSTQNLGLTMIYDGAPLEPPTQMIPFFDNEGSLMAYITSFDESSYVFADGEIGRPYSEIGLLTISPDEEKIAYAGSREDQWMVVVDRIEQSQKFDEIASITFSPDSKHLAYVAREGDAWFVIVDEVKGNAYSEILRLWDAIVFDSNDNLHYLGVRRADNGNGEVILVEEIID